MVQRTARERYMKCKECGETESWHGWAQAPYCSPYCKAGRPQGETHIFGEWTRNQRTEIIGLEKNILQPVKRDGTLDKRFIDTYGTKKIKKEFRITSKQIKENLEKPRKTVHEMAAENV